jgi:hypothetical protein
MIFALEKDNDITYTFRVHEDYGTADYLYAMPITYRPNYGFGLWEAHTWNTIAKLIPGVKLTWYSDSMYWIIYQLKCMEPNRFVALIGTFETKRLKFYERLFRQKFILAPILSGDRTHNGDTRNYTVVEYIKR